MDIKWKNNRAISVILGIIFLASSAVLLIKLREIRSNYDYQVVVDENKNNIYNDQNILNYITEIDSNLVNYFRDYIDLEGTVRKEEIAARMEYSYSDTTEEGQKAELEEVINSISGYADEFKRKLLDSNTNIQYYLEDTKGNFITNMDSEDYQYIKSDWNPEYYFMKISGSYEVFASDEINRIGYNIPTTADGGLQTTYISRYYRIPKNLSVSDYLYQTQSKYNRVAYEYSRDKNQKLLLTFVTILILIIFLMNLYISFKGDKNKIFIIRLIRNIRKTYMESRIVKSTHYKVITVLLGLLLLILAALILGYRSAVSGWIYYGRVSLTVMACIFYITGYLVFIVISLLKLSGNLNKVKLATDNIVKGNYNQDIEIKGPYVLKSIGENVKNIDEGLEKAVSEAIKSEKMKSELISNVSHDLKTPLTSILSYVDFLKKDNLSEEDRNKYVNVLDKKSKRLKILIDDLFEASKAATGNLELDIQEIEIAALLRQTLGEFQEKIEESNLTFIKNLPEEKIYLRLDGRKTWRIFENLIGNALKYSLDNSRVYIDIIDEEDKVIITMKNVSNHILDFTGEEAMERFKRGDVARTTEGSGLGLAISKNLVNIQGGSFRIDIDGDLFKAIIEFKK